MLTRLAFMADPHGELATITSACWAELQRLASLGGIDETGGVLLGQWDQGQLRIQWCLDAPPDSVRTPSAFYRGTEGLMDALVDQAIRNGWGYVGEWHTHPAWLPTASPDDLDGLRQVALDPDMNSAAPCMLILGGKIKDVPPAYLYLWNPAAGDSIRLTPTFWM